MFINKTGFNGYYKPGIKNNKKKSQKIETDSAIEFEKEKNSKERKKSFPQEQDDLDKELDNKEFQREDNEFINIFV